MPVLVGALGDQVLDLLLAVYRARVTELAGVGAEPHAQLALRGRHLGERLGSAHGQALDRRARAALGLVAGCNYCLLKVTSQAIRK
jgi:hypothetical protein